MDENIRIPVKLNKVKDPNGKEVLKPTVPIQLIFSKDFSSDWLEKELIGIERRYYYLVTCLNSLLNSIRSETHKNRRVILYWEFGNKIIEFEEPNKDNPLFFESLTKSLVRDIRVSEKMIGRCKRFRILYPDITKIDTSKSFNKYVASFESGYISDKTKIKNDTC